MQKSTIVKRPTRRETLLDRIRKTLGTGDAVKLKNPPGGGYREAFAREGLILQSMSVYGGYAVWVEKRKGSAR